MDLEVKEYHNPFKQFFTEFGKLNSTQTMAILND